MWLHLTLLACSTCPSFEETQITGASAEQRAEIEAALADMQAWTGLDGVCVREVRMVGAEELPDSRGIWRGRNIELRETISGESLRFITRHELCHALDDHLGLSEQAPELFTGDYIQSDNYDTESLRRAEDFADACQHGPAVDSALATLLAPECDLDLGLSEREQWLMDHAFVWPDTGAWQTPRVPMELGDGLLRGERAPGAFYADALWRDQRWYLAGTQLPTIVDGRRQPWLMVVDPLTRQQVQRVDLPLAPMPTHDLQPSQLVPGDDGLYLVLADGPGTTLRVQDDGTVEPHAPLASLTEADRDLLAVYDGWLYLAEDGVLQRWELQGAQVELLDLPSPLQDTVYPWAPTVLSDTLSWVESSALPLWVDLPTGTVHATSVPPDGWAHQAQPLADGSVLSAVPVPGVGMLPAVYRPDSSVWHLPADPCGLLYEYTWDNLLTLDDGPWLETLAEPGLIRPLLVE